MSLFVNYLMWIFFLVSVTFSYNICLIIEPNESRKCGNIPVIGYDNFSQIEYPYNKNDIFSIFIPATHQILNVTLTKKDHDQRRILFGGNGYITLKFENGLNMTELFIEKNLTIKIAENKNIAYFNDLIFKGRLVVISEKEKIEPLRVLDRLVIGGNTLVDFSWLTSSEFKPTLYFESNSISCLIITSRQITPHALTNVSFRPIKSYKYKKVVFLSSMSKPLKLSFKNTHGLHIDTFPSFIFEGKIKPIYFDQSWDQPITCTNKGYFKSSYLEPINIRVDSDHDIVSNLIEFNSVTNFTLNGCQGKYALGLDRDPPDLEMMTIPYNQKEKIDYKFLPYQNSISLVFLTYSKDKGSARLSSFDPSVKIISIFGNSQQEMVLDIDNSNVTSIDISSVTVLLKSKSTNLSFESLNIYGNGIIKISAKESKKIYINNILVFYGQVITVYENRICVGTLNVDSQFFMNSMEIFYDIGKIIIAEDAFVPKEIAVGPNSITVKHADSRIDDLVIPSTIADNNEINLEIICNLLKYTTIIISWEGKEGEKIHNIPNIFFVQDASPIILFDKSWCLNPPSPECSFPCKIEGKEEVFIKKEFEMSLIPSLFNFDKHCVILNDTRGWYCAISSLQDAQYCTPQDTFVVIKHGYFDYPFESDDKMECTIRIVCREIFIRSSMFNGADLELICVNNGTIATVNMIWDHNLNPSDLMLHNVKLVILTNEDDCIIELKKLKASFGSQIYSRKRHIKLRVYDVIDVGLFLIGNLILENILQPFSRDNNNLFMRINYDYKSVESISSVVFTSDALILNDYHGSDWKIDYDYYGKLEIAVCGQSKGNSFITIDNRCPSYTELSKVLDFVVVDSFCTVTFTERWLTMSPLCSSRFVRGILYSKNPDMLQVRSEYPDLPTDLFILGLNVKTSLRYDDLYYLTPNDNDNYPNAKTIKFSHQQVLKRESFQSLVHDKIFIKLNGTTSNMLPILSSELLQFNIFIMKAFMNQSTQYISLHSGSYGAHLYLSGVNSSIGPKSEFSTIMLKNSFITGYNLSTGGLEVNYSSFVDPYFSTFSHIYTLSLFDPRIYDFSMKIPNVQHIHIIYTFNTSKTFQCIFCLSSGSVYKRINIEQRSLSSLFVYFRDEWINNSKDVSFRSAFLFRKGFELTGISRSNFNFSKFFEGKMEHNIILDDGYFCFYKTNKMKEMCPYSHQMYQYTSSDPIPANLFKDVQYRINLFIADNEPAHGPTFAPNAFSDKNLYITSFQPQKVWIDCTGKFPKSIFLENIHLYFEKERFVVPHFNVLSISRTSSINAFSMSISVGHLIAFPESMPHILDQTKETKISLILPDTFNKMVCSNEYEFYFGADEPMRIVYDTYKELTIYVSTINILIDIKNPHHTPTHEAILYNVPNIKASEKATVTFTEAWKSENARTEKKARIDTKDLTVYSRWGSYPEDVFKFDKPKLYLNVQGHYCIYNKKPSINVCPRHAAPVFYSPEKPVDRILFAKSIPYYCFYIADTIQGGAIFDGSDLKNNVTFIGIRNQNITIVVDEYWPKPRIALKYVNVHFKGKNLTELSMLNLSNSLISGSFLNVSNSITVKGSLSEISACWCYILKERQDINLILNSFNIVDIGDTKITIIDKSSIQRYIIPRKSVRRLTFTSLNNSTSLTIKSSANSTIAFMPNFVLRYRNVFLDDSLYTIFANNRSRGRIHTIGNVTISSNQNRLPDAYLVEGNYIANFSGFPTPTEKPKAIEQSNVLRNVAIACVFVAITLVCAVVVVKRTFGRMDYNNLVGIEVSESSALQSLSVAGM